MCIMWGVVVVFVMLNEEILHRVVRHKSFDPLGVFEDSPKTSIDY